MDYYIALCGGYSENADRKNIVAYLPNSAAYQKKKFLFFSFSPSILPGSTIEVPVRGERKAEFVEVRGAVRKPALIHFRKGEKLDYYIALCGGYSEKADAGRTIVHLPDGRTLDAGGALSFNPYLAPGSVVEVPFKGEPAVSGSGDVEVRGAVS